MLNSDRLLILSKEEDNKRYISELYEVCKDELFQEYLHMPLAQSGDDFERKIGMSFIRTECKCFLGRSKIDEKLVCFMILNGLSRYCLVYGVLPEYRNQGYGRELVKTVSESLGVPIDASVRWNNIASQKCLTAAGFKQIDPQFKVHRPYDVSKLPVHYRYEP